MTANFGSILDCRTRGTPFLVCAGPDIPAPELRRRPRPQLRMPVTLGGAVQGDQIKRDEAVGLAKSLFDDKRTQVLASGARIVPPAYKDLTSAR